MSPLSHIFVSKLTFKVEESDKYPLKIQKLFAPQLPFLYKPPLGYSPEKRATSKITSLSPWKQAIEQYKEEFLGKPMDEPPAELKKRLHEQSLQRQLTEWDDTEAFSQNEFLKDPYRTVFVARLYYSLTELDLSKHFSRFGAIESLRVVRDKNGQSRGYGFIVFERDSDASNCIRELAPIGLAVEPTKGKKPRKILVDMERGRLMRNWKPRRLGGGLGGRHYTSPSANHSRDASAASSGRRLNLTQNPYQQATAHESNHNNKRPFNDRPAAPNKRPGPAYDYYSSRSNPSAISPVAMSYSPVTTGPARNGQTESSTVQSLKDKYAKYLSTSNDNSSGYKPSGESGRSIRSIRQRE